MNTTDIFGPPVLGPVQPAVGKWAREYEAFLRLLPDLLREHRGQYVAVHDGRVVGVGGDKVTVAKHAYQEFGPVEILVRQVTDEPPRVVQIVSPRVTPPEGG
jgi:hypothetical protein